MKPATAAVERCVHNAVDECRGEPAPLLEILHSVQRQLGCVPAESVPLIAEALNLSRAEVHGVVTFYHHFRDAPAGKHTLQLCRAEACQSMNADALAEFARKTLGMDFGETRADGLVTLDAVYCLGNCACAPSAMIDGEIRGRLDTQTIAEFARLCGVAE